MATILSQSSTTGFYKAPVSKGLMGCMFLTCTALHVPLLAHWNQYLVCRLPEAFFKFEIWRIISAKLSFVNTKDIVFGSLLIYYFRIFERRFGSQKFASSLVALNVVTACLEVITVLIFQWFGFDIHNGGCLPPGPYGVIFPLFVNYYFDIPRVAQTLFLGIPITGKTLTYLFGLQVCSTSSATFISAICGICAGVLYRKNALCIASIKWIPDWLSSLASKTFGKLLASSPPQEGPVGATLELQRQEQIEFWEQQMMLDRARELRNRGGAANPAVPPFVQNWMNRGDNNPENGHPTEEQIQTLVEMGFDRQNVISALQSSNNDINAATMILLHDS